MGQLSGKVAAVTGASSGIGRVIAETLGCEGAHVFMSGRATDGMEASKSLIESSGGGATLAAFDIRDLDALASFVMAAADQGDGLDIMVNNAGLGAGYSICDGDPEDWREMMDVNVLGVLMGCKTAIAAMRRDKREGSIINISSTAALRRDSGVYGATKAAVNLITSSMREELQEDTIRVSSIMPGYFMSNFIRNMPAEAVTQMARRAGIENLDFKQGEKLPPEMLEQLRAPVAERVGDPQAIADTILHIVTQPIGIAIEEVVIRPRKNL